MNKKHWISPDHLGIEAVMAALTDGTTLGLSPESTVLIRRCRNFLEECLDREDQLFYGINTGFGSLCNIQISHAEIEALQQNLVRSHACGAGEEAPAEIVRIMLFLKAQSLSYGYSGVREELVQRLLEFFNHDITPVVYQLGSLGASGDLAPLAHLSLPIIGDGEVYYRKEKMKSSEALRRAGITPLALKAKEGLALLNGTQFSTAYAVWCTHHAKRLSRIANRCAALSMDAFDCRLSPLDKRLHDIRPHAGQVQTAADVLQLLEGSEIARQPKVNVQDPYAFRCVPQVHGASWDAINYAVSVTLTEVNAVTDNPNIFSEGGDILSGGNFHAQPLALALDFLAIALAELGSISERRTYQLISGNRGLPAFLIADPGLHSGLMIPQYTAASVASQNKQLCTPASVDSIVSSNGQEDHVSMAANAATKAWRVVKNVETILAIEWMTAAQALEFRRPAKTSPALEALVAQYRTIVPKLEADRILQEDIAKTIVFLQEQL
ncbi:MAG: histidine ammonia-lyase [Saprospiraceae bacterium]|nr:histidine ammonia-lyase [Saprospiraceae bacterium]